MHYSYDLWLEELGARIKQLRKGRGWTLRDMVVQHGFHLTHWQGFERGKKGISVPSLMRVAELFDMTLCQLLEGLGEVPTVHQRLYFGDSEQLGWNQLSGSGLVNLQRSPGEPADSRAGRINRVYFLCPFQAARQRQRPDQWLPKCDGKSRYPELLSVASAGALPPRDRHAPSLYRHSCLADSRGNWPAVWRGHATLGQPGCGRMVCKHNRTC